MAADPMTQPDDNYQADCVDPVAMERLARRCMAVTGTPQRLHVHPAGERCRAGCRTVAP